MASTHAGMARDRPGGVEIRGATRLPGMPDLRGIPEFASKLINFDEENHPI